MSDASSTRAQPSERTHTLVRVKLRMQTSPGYFREKGALKVKGSGADVEGGEKEEERDGEGGWGGRGFRQSSCQPLSP